MENNLLIFKNEVELKLQGPSPEQFRSTRNVYYAIAKYTFLSVGRHFYNTMEISESNYFSWKDTLLWKEKVWNIIRELIPKTLRKKLKSLSDIDYISWYDKGWLEELTDNTDILDLDHFLFEQLFIIYDGIIAYHCSKVKYTTTYYKNGIKILDIDFFNKLAQKLFLTPDNP